MTKRLTALALAAVLALGLSGPMGLTAQAASGVQRADKTVTLSGGSSRNITALEVDLTDPGIRIFSVHAKDTVGATASLKDIAAQLAGSQYEVVAAINGTFFQAYDSYKAAVGTVVSRGEMLHKFGGTFIGFGLDNTVKIDWISPQTIGWTGGVKDSAHGFYVHQWNRLLPATGSYREGILTPAFGSTTGDTDMVTVVVQQDVITAIGSGNTAIPKDGFVYVMPQSSAYNDGRFKVGQCFEYGTTFQNADKQEVDWSGMYSITGVGPSLVLKGQKTADAQSENWTDVKLTQNAAQRSFIGYDTAGKKLTFGTAPNCTIDQLGDVAVAYGLFDAMNLDGGASSGLLYQGEYLSKPGRELSNAIVVVRLKQPDMSVWARSAIAQGAALRYIPADLQSGYLGSVSRQDYCRTILEMLQRRTLMGKAELVAHFGQAMASGRFSDVTAHREAILAANALGIVSGRSDALFDPSGVITRAEAATMLANTARRFGVENQGSVSHVRYSDAADIPDWARESVDIVTRMGIMNGQDGRFEPSGTLTREQCFAVVLRLAQYIPQLAGQR